MAVWPGRGEEGVIRGVQPLQAAVCTEATAEDEIDKSNILFVGVNGVPEEDLMAKSIASS